MINRLDIKMRTEITRYLCAGGLAFIVDFLSLAILAFIGIHYVLAASIAFLLGSWVNYQLSINWVFSYRALQSTKAEIRTFFLIGIMSLGIGMTLIVVMVEHMKWNLLFSKIVATTVTLLLNFLCRKLFLFTPSRPNLEVVSSTAR